MEILARLVNFLSPSFFAILAGLSFTAAGLLFVAGRHSTPDLLAISGKLSKLEPPEYRGAGYLVLAFGWSMLGLILGFIFTAITSFLGSLIYVILSLLCLLFTLCFLYAGGAALLHAVTGQKGGLVPWFFPPMRYINTQIAQFGDWLTAGLLRPSWPQQISAGVGGGAEAAEETARTAMPGHLKENFAKQVEKLHAALAQYEAHLSLEQKEKLTEMRAIVEELRSLYP